MPVGVKIDESLKEKITTGGLLKNSIMNCFYKTLPSTGIVPVSDGVSFKTSNGTVTIHTYKGILSGPSATVVKDAHLKLKMCVNPKAEGIHEAKKLRLVSKQYGELTGDPKLDAMALAGEYVTGAKGTPMTAIQKLQGKGRKTRKGKKTRRR